MKKQSRLQHRLEMMSVAEAARALSLTPDQVNRRIEAGELKCFRLGPDGQAVRIVRVDLETYLRETNSSANSESN